VIVTALPLVLWLPKFVTYSLYVAVPLSSPGIKLVGPATDWTDQAGPGAAAAADEVTAPSNAAALNPSIATTRAAHGTNSREINAPAETLRW
jgi:hypothetical protein